MLLHFKMVFCSEGNSFYLFDNRDELQFKPQVLETKFSFFIPYL